MGHPARVVAQAAQGRRDQLFIVSNRDSTYYFANNNARHFAFNADERFLPIYQYAAPDNSKLTGLHPFADAFLAKCTLGHMLNRYMVLVASVYRRVCGDLEEATNVDLSMVVTRRVGTSMWS